MELRVHVAYALFCVSVLQAVVLCAAPLRLYTTPQNPKDNPDYQRYAVKHPTFETFDNAIQLATLRGFSIDSNDTVVDYTQDLEKFCLNESTALGSVVWPMYPLLFTHNYKDVIDAIHKSGLYVTDVWGFVPGAGPGDGKKWRQDVWQQFQPPKVVLEYLESTLGDRWLGMDVGEQDGRYIGSYANQLVPLGSNRKEQYINFRNHFKGMEDILGPKLVSLISLTYPHYMGKTGLYTMIGAETAQALPNGQVFYAFIRGAGKQYGVLWFGNASVYNRFGYKTYSSPTSTRPVQDATRSYRCSSQAEGGPTCGTSLNLMKRLMYAHIMYSSPYIGLENGWFFGSKPSLLSPIGDLQLGAKKFLTNVKTLGTHVATVALFIDFYSGFCPPRHLYSGNLYRVWGNLPYSHGDFLTDNILQMFYPQYQDSSYFHNETGFSSHTPYGDSIDVLLSDAQPWVLQQYDTVVVASNLTGSEEVKRNLEGFIRGGGNLVLTVGNLAVMPNGILGVSTQLKCKIYAGKNTVHVRGGYTLMEKYNMSVCDVDYPTNASVLATVNETVLAIQLILKDGGSLSVFTTPFGQSIHAINTPVSRIDFTLSSPYPLLEHVKFIMNEIFYNATLFTSPANLTLTTSFSGLNNTFNVLVSNPVLQQQPLKIYSPRGQITKMQEIPLDQSEKGAVGYLPDGFEGTDIGNSTDTTVAGGDTRLFTVTLVPGDVTILPKVIPKPPPEGIGIRLWKIEHSIRYEVLLRPTFFQHFSSVIVSQSYLIERDTEFLSNEQLWLKQQGLSVYVDASPSIDLFPYIRLTNNTYAAYNQSMELLMDLLDKMSVLGSTDLLISLHRVPDAMSLPAALLDFNDTIHKLVQYAAQLHINIHILDASKNPLRTELLKSWLDTVGLQSAVKIALNTAILIDEGTTPDVLKSLVSQASFVLLSTPAYDDIGVLYSTNVPISTADTKTKNQLLSIISNVCSFRGYCPYGNMEWKDGNFPFVLNGYFQNTDEEFLDVNLLENFLMKP